MNITVARIKHIVRHVLQGARNSRAARVRRDERARLDMAAMRSGSIEASPNNPSGESQVPPPVDKFFKNLLTIAVIVSALLFVAIQVVEKFKLYKEQAPAREVAAEKQAQLMAVDDAINAVTSARKALISNATAPRLTGAYATTFAVASNSLGNAYMNLTHTQGLCDAGEKYAYFALTFSEPQPACWKKAGDKIRISYADGTEPGVYEVSDFDMSPAALESAAKVTNVSLAIVRQTEALQGSPQRTDPKVR
ncbi:hypothetical protein [Variovorax sp. LG9.2]|uniref:hypothetical protein n=1 Tax=Variovorax sp. LG9.2 TaxID=3048626 RepID=UPI002B23B0CE|nr:hypothetical protein [Variovorax sp. LG9.2]MEB0060152.1 hypothetical protein [Variovorax sp. LG9.2]